jgi:hypothetical protein
VLEVRDGGAGDLGWVRDGGEDASEVQVRPHRRSNTRRVTPSLPGVYERSDYFTSYERGFADDQAGMKRLTRIELEACLLKASHLRLLRWDESEMAVESIKCIYIYMVI